MSEPVSIDPARFFDFVGGPGLAVVFVSIHPAHAFNGALCGHLRDGREDDVAFGTVGLRDLVLSAGRALPFLHEGLRACGGPSELGIVPGYWLFREGQVLAWDCGLPTGADAKAIAGSALLGAIWTAVTGRLGFVREAIRVGVEEAAARHVAAVFRQAAAARREEGERASSAWRPGPPSFDELLRAYRTLGVPATATDDEVKRAWRRRQMENHPDRAANDPVEFERRSRLAAEINRAREVILNHRARATA